MAIRRHGNVQLPVFAGDQPATVAREFAIKYGLNDADATSISNVRPSGRAGGRVPRFVCVWGGFFMSGTGSHRAPEPLSLSLYCFQILDFRGPSHSPRE